MVSQVAQAYVENAFEVAEEDLILYLQDRMLAIEP